MAYQGGGNLKSTSINGVKMYSVTGQHRSLATWLAPKKLKALRKDKDYLQRVDLIQDLRFETATTRIKATPDGEFLIASGIYPPQVKVYELRELSLKFERHLVSEIINFQVLGEDYSKIAFLCADRSVRLHAKYGSHYSLLLVLEVYSAMRLLGPNNLFLLMMGRDMTYDCWSCDLICAASSPDLYRINLEQGRFLSSLNTQSPAINVVSRSHLHGLIASGGEDGAIECFDMRARSSVGRIDAVAPAGDVDQEVTAIEFDGDGGYLMAVGSSAGKVLIYDLRSSHPLRVKDHMYGSKIMNIKWHRTLNSERTKLITTDEHIVRIWDPDTGEGMTSIEPTGGKINDICVFRESGLILLALDSSQIPSYFIPALGPAPKWCSYLENLTEELEEGAQTTIYDDFKFLTKEDLERLNLTNLIGTNLLRAYMHGFFIDYRLYKKAQALADPFAYDTYIEKRKREKQEKERASQITIKRKLPKVNRTLAARLLENEEGETEKKDSDEAAVITKKTSKKRKGLTTEVMKDERFAAMFENKDFEVDEFSPEYLALHPLATTTQPSLVEEHFEAVSEDGDQSLSDPQPSDDDDDDDGNESRPRNRVPSCYYILLSIGFVDLMNAILQFLKILDLLLYEVKDERHAEAFWNRVSLAKEDALPLGERVAASRSKNQGPRTWNNVKSGPGGSREISFISRSKAKYKEDEDDMEAPREKRRGVQSLGLKPDQSSSRGRGRGRGGRGSRGRGGRSRGRGRW
ncbi:hypothetical protein LguiB_004158 [Lonicera macranthoides]